MAMALMVKSNCGYLLPAFVLTTGMTIQQFEWRRALRFLTIVTLLAGAIYFVLWRRYPTEFTQAFAFELDGDRLKDSRILFQIGRLGLNFVQSFNAVARLLRGDPC